MNKLVIQSHVLNNPLLLCTGDSAIPSGKISEGWRGRLGCGQTDGLHSSQIRPPNHGTHAQHGITYLYIVHLQVTNPNVPFGSIPLLH